MKLFKKENTMKITPIAGLFFISLHPNDKRIGKNSFWKLFVYIRKIRKIEDFLYIFEK